MSTEHEALDQARIVAYVDGELSGEERERFEDELSVNDALRGELESFLRLDVLERHFHASTQASAAPAEPTPETRLRIVRWLPVAAAAALLVALAWMQFRPDAGGSLQVLVASAAEDLFDTNRAPDPASSQLHLGFLAPDAGFVRIFGQDDLGRWYALNTGILKREEAVDGGRERFGGYERTWIDERGEERTYRGFVVLFSKISLSSDAVAAALSELEGATAEDLRQTLEEAFDVQTGSVVVESD